jgi:hypothetical protein
VSRPATSSGTMPAFDAPPNGHGARAFAAAVSQLFALTPWRVFAIGAELVGARLEDTDAEHVVVVSPAPALLVFRDEATLDAMITVDEDGTMRGATEIPSYVAIELAGEEPRCVQVLEGGDEEPASRRRLLAAECLALAFTELLRSVPEEALRAAARGAAAIARTLEVRAHDGVTRQVTLAVPAARLPEPRRAHRSNRVA